MAAACPFSDFFAIIQDSDYVANPHHKFHIMLDKEDCHT